jgi:uncharacterized protein (DUF427 family)
VIPIAIRPLGRPVRVSIGGQVVAESERALLLDETGHPERIYVPREDVTAPVEPGDKRSHCPWKGDASWWNVAGAANVAWSYDDPKDRVSEIRGHLSFRGDDVKIG